MKVFHTPNHAPASVCMTQRTEINEKEEGWEWDYSFFPHTALLFPTPISRLTSFRMMSIKTLPTLVPRPMEGSSKCAFTGCWISSPPSKLLGISGSPKFNYGTTLSNLGLGKLALPITSVHWIKHSTCYTIMDSSKHYSSESWGGKEGPLAANDLMPVWWVEDTS